MNPGTERTPEAPGRFPRLCRWKCLADGGRRLCTLCVGCYMLLFSAGCTKNASDSAHIVLLPGSVFSQVEVIGSRGTGPGEFNKPRSLALDTNDNLYVVDMTGRVQKFSPQGKFLLSWQMPQTDLGKPKGMSRDRDGNIVVLEPHYQRVNHFTPDGKLVAQWGVKGTNAGELTLPRAIAVDSKNNLIVSEYTLVDRVQKFSPFGKKCLTTWGTPGLALGEFNRAEGLGVDAKDRIYVADSCNHRIQIFSSDGNFIRAHGQPGERAGELSYPYDIQVDEQGRQYVCEFGNSRIQVFDANDRPLEIIGHAGGEPGEFANPWSIALDSKGNLYVADSQNHRVQKLVRSSRPRAQNSRPAAVSLAVGGGMGRKACRGAPFLFNGEWLGNPIVGDLYVESAGITSLHPQSHLSLRGGRNPTCASLDLALFSAPTLKIGARTSDMATR